MNIFVQHDGETFGPFSREQVVAHVQEGILSMDDLACTGGNLEGRPLKDLLKEMADELPPEQVPAEQENPVAESAIFVEHDGETFGPFSREQVVAHVQEGVLSMDDLACTEGNLEGRPLKDLLEESQQATPASKVPQQDAERPPSLLDLQIFRQLAIVNQPKAASGGRRSLVLAAVCLVFFLGGGVVTYFTFKPKLPMIATVTLSPQTSTASATNAPAHQGTNVTETQASVGTALATNTSVQSSTPVTTPAVPELTSTTNEVPDQNPASIPAANTPPPAKLVAAAQKQPAPVLAATHQITFPKPLPTEKGKPRADLWVADTAASPKAILVMCLAPGGNAQGAVKSGAWQNFAKENGFALTAIAFSSDQDMLKTDDADARAGAAAMNMFLSGLHGYYGDKVPLIVYGHDAGGAFALNIASWHPEIVKAWGAYMKDWPSDPYPGKISPPGILACDIEPIQRGKTNVAALFKAGRAMNKPWTLIPMAAEPKSRQQMLDMFFCDYVKACLSLAPAQNPGALVGTDSKKLFTSLESMTKAKDATWLPDASLIDEWTTLMSDDDLGGKPMILRKDIVTFNPEQPQLKMYLRLPPGIKSGKDVTGVLAYCTWDSNETTILATLSIQENEKLTGLDAHHSGTLANLIKFADAHNMAVLTWGTTTIWNKAVNNEDMAASEQHQLDLAFDALATAWEKGVNQFASETGLPTKDFLLYGISRGAQWAHRLALRKPAYFLAVDVHIPSTFDVPTPDANRALWLLTTGEQEYGYESAKRFYKECAALGYPIIFKAIPNLGHLDSPIADNLTSQFFEYALSVRSIHDAHEMQLQNHFMLVSNQHVPPWIQSFREPDFFGDLLNQDCFPKAEVSMIEPTLRVPLPTKALADAWNK